MKKAAIISLYGNHNYGNKLQNYAVQEILKKHNLIVENIINIPCFNNKKRNYIARIAFYKNYLLYKLFYKIKITDCLNRNDSKEKQHNFLKFNEKINNTKTYFSFSKIDLFLDYDYFFVGSDQIWNPNFGGLSDLDLLTFTNKRKIALSVSFGINEIPKQYHQKLKQALTSFDGISVREEEGKKIIKELTKINSVSVLIDPTMLLTAEEWNQVAKKPKTNIPKKYILCYFLGSIDNQQYKEIQILAKKNNCEIINILDQNDKYNSCGPSEFLYLESKAYLICTDSFHSCIFAILYNIPFIVYERKNKNNNMHSRIITLLNKFKLNERLYKPKYTNINKMINIDYKEANKVLIQERKKYNDFLKKHIK